MRLLKWRQFPRRKGSRGSTPLGFVLVFLFTSLLSYNDLKQWCLAEMEVWTAPVSYLWLGFTCSAEQQYPKIKRLQHQHWQTQHPPRSWCSCLLGLLWLNSTRIYLSNRKIFHIYTVYERLLHKCEQGLWNWRNLFLFYPREFKVRHEVQKVKHALSAFRPVFFFLQIRYTKIWTQPPPGNLVNPPVTSWSQLLSQVSLQRSDRQLPALGFDRARFSCLASACLCLETFTVSWLSSRNNRQMLNQPLAVHSFFFLNKRARWIKAFETAGKKPLGF